MEPALKQRLIGATVLVALAVIFLPMLIKGPAPESGVSDVPLDLPDAPKGQFETRELPLVGPGEAPQGGAVGMTATADPDKLPTVDTTAAAAPAASDAVLPAASAGGNYAVSFGSYASTVDAERVVKALQAAQLPGYQESVPGSGGRTLHRVRIGPFETQAQAEDARLQSGKVRTDVGAKVVVLDAEAAAPAASAAPPATASVSQPIATSTPSVSAPQPLAASTPAKPTPLPEPKKPTPAPTAAVTPPKPAAPAQAKVEPAKPAASSVGFAVQLGAFGSAAEADKLRDRARAAGFSAFVEQVRTDKGTLNRVRIGPVASRGDADQLKAQVAAKLGVSGIVRPHP